MERQLKERLVGAAVLIAAAVLLVPEMFSGSAEHAATPTQPVMADSSEGSSGQVKTYRLDLQAGPEAASSAPIIEPPAPPPPTAPPTETVSTDANSSAPVVTSDDSALVASGASSSSRSSEKPAEKLPEKPPAPQPKAAEVAAVKESPVTDKPVRPAAAAAGQWVVQVGSFGTEAKAQEVARAVGGELKVAVSPVKVGSKTLYRVRSSGFADRSAAERALGRVKGQFPGASVMPR